MPWYRIHYTNALLTKVLDELDQKVDVIVDIDPRGNNVSMIGNGIVPNCKNNSSLCAVNVNKQTALSTAQSYGFNTNSSTTLIFIGLTMGSDAGWEWWFLDRNSCKTLEINIVSKKTDYSGEPCIRR